MVCTTSGLVDFELSVAADGHQDFADADVPDGAQISYVAEDASRTEWEVGRGSWTEYGGVLTRDEILDSSTGGSKIDFTTEPEVFIDVVRQDLDDLLDEANNHATAMAIALGG